MRQSNVNWYLYRSFLAVYETKSFPAAAEIVGVTKAAVAKNIKELSKQHDTELFIGNPKGVEPTSAAVALYPFIKIAADAIFDGESAMREFNESSKAVIRMAIPSTTASIEFIDYFKQFKKMYPNVRLEFHRKDSQELLAQHKIDFAVDYKTSFVGYNFNIEKLIADEHIFIASKAFLKEHNLKTTMAIEELRSDILITDQEFLDKLTKDLNLEMPPALIVSTYEMLFAMVKKGLGIGYFSDITFNKIEDKGDVVKLKVPGFETEHDEFVVAYHKGSLTQAARAFIDGLVEFLSHPH